MSMPWGKQPQPGRGRDHDEEEKKDADTRPTGSQNPVGSPIQDASDILRLEPRAMNIFGEDWVASALRAGRGLGVGNARMPPNSAAAPGPGESTNSASRVTESRNLDSSNSMAFATTESYYPANTSNSASDISRTGTGVQRAPGYQAQRSTSRFMAMQLFPQITQTNITVAGVQRAPSYQGQRSTSRFMHLFPRNQNNTEVAGVQPTSDSYNQTQGQGSTSIDLGGLNNINVVTSGSLGRLNNNIPRSSDAGGTFSSSTPVATHMNFPRVNSRYTVPSPSNWADSSSFYRGQDSASSRTARAGPSSNNNVVPEVHRTSYNQAGAPTSSVPTGPNHTNIAAVGVQRASYSQGQVSASQVSAGPNHANVAHPEYQQYASLQGRAFMPRFPAGPEQTNNSVAGVQQGYFNQGQASTSRLLARPSENNIAVAGVQQGYYNQGQASTSRLLARPNENNIAVAGAQQGYYNQGQASTSRLLARPNENNIAVAGVQQGYYNQGQASTSRLLARPSENNIVFAGIQRNQHNQGQGLAGRARAGQNNARFGFGNLTTALPAEYLGDPRLAENYSADIPMEQSTSLFIKDLPADVTIPQILGAIRKTGKVYSLFLNPPTPPHTGSAAKLCFFTREAAATFFGNTRGGFLVNGHMATVIWNRVLLAEHVGPQYDEASRVVIVQGPKDLVNAETIADIIAKEIRLYDLVLVIETDYTLVTSKGYWELEVHFGSFRAQGHSAFIVLNRALGEKGVKVSYGPDPCA